MIRIVEHNDWVIFTLLGCITALSLMLISLQREASLKDFLLQNIEDSSNIYISWIIVSVVNVILISILLSQFIPIVPDFAKDLSLFGLELNKFGFTFYSVSLYYLLKICFTYLYFYSVRNQQAWQKFYFAATKFYFVLSILLIVAILMQFYFSSSRLKTLQGYWVFFAVVFVFKNIYYLFHNYRIMPQLWYYKILYICTLQIIPLLVLCKFLFD